MLLSTTGDELLRIVNIDDLDWPWTLKIEVVIFWQFLAAEEWIATKWMEKDRNCYRLLHVHWALAISCSFLYVCLALTTDSTTALTKIYALKKFKSLSSLVNILQDKWCPEKPPKMQLLCQNKHNKQYQLSKKTRRDVKSNLLTYTWRLRTNETGEQNVVLRHDWCVAANACRHPSFDSQ